MPDSKITALTAITTVNPATFPLVIVDTSDTSMAITGTTKKVTTNQLLGSGGTATLASATITGDLTVDTSTLKVDSANNRVGIGTATPSSDLHIRRSGGGSTLEMLRLDNAGAGVNSAVQMTFWAAGTNYGNITGGFGGATPILEYNVGTTGYHGWQIAGSEQMRLNSNGLGVGTSPAEKLTVAGKIRSVSSTFGLSDVIAETTAGTGTGYARLIVKTADREWRIINDASTSGSPFIIYDATANAESLRIATAGVYTFGDGAGGTRMTLNSTGLGVGVSPGYPLHVQRATAGPTAWLANSTTYSQLKMVSSGTNQPVYVTLNPTGTGAAIFQISDVDRLTIDSSGNVGIGVTPSAWSVSGKTIDITSTGSFEAIGGNSTSFSYNRYFTGASNIYKTTGFAAIYSQNNAGQHTWFTAPSGTAGTAITFTQAMTLDASGNLLVGTTSPLSSVSGSSQIALGGAGLQTTSQAISAATATTICRSGSGGMAVVGGYNGTGQYSAIIIFSYGAGGGVTVVSSQNNTGSTITYALSGVNVQITSSLALTNLTTTCIRTA